MSRLSPSFHDSCYPSFFEILNCDMHTK
jgi:hypothetical protein